MRTTIPSALERRAHKIAVAPDQTTSAHGAEAVEGDAKLGGQDGEAGEPDARSVIGDVSDATALNALLAIEIHQHTAIDRSAAERAPLELKRRLEYLVERRHVAPADLWDKVAGRSMTADDYASVGPDGAIPGSRGNYRVDAIAQRNSLVKLDLAAAG